MFKNELQSFLKNLGIVHLGMALIAFVFAYFLSNYITKSLTRISEKIKTTKLNKENAKIDIEKTPMEVSILIDSYNTMIDDLENSAIKLARSERETAWREMALIVTFLRGKRISTQDYCLKTQNLNHI